MFKFQKILASYFDEIDLYGVLICYLPISVGTVAISVGIIEALLNYFDWSLLFIVNYIAFVFVLLFNWLHDYCNFGSMITVALSWSIELSTYSGYETAVIAITGLLWIPGIIVPDPVFIAEEIKGFFE